MVFTGIAGAVTTVAASAITRTVGTVLAGITGAVAAIGSAAVNTAVGSVFFSFTDTVTATVTSIRRSGGLLYAIIGTGVTVFKRVTKPVTAVARTCRVTFTFSIETIYSTVTVIINTITAINFRRFRWAAIIRTSTTVFILTALSVSTLEYDLNMSSKLVGHCDMFGQMRMCSKTIIREDTFRHLVIVVSAL